MTDKIPPWTKDEIERLKKFFDGVKSNKQDIPLKRTQINHQAF